jgi:hypothetical protein
LEKTVRFSFNPKMNDLVTSTSESSCDSFQYNRNIVNSITTLSLGANLQVAYNNKGIISVTLPRTIGDQLSFRVKEKGMQIGSDLTLPFYNWFIHVALRVNEFGTKQSNDNLAFALCYLNNLALNSKFKVMNQLFDEYAKTIQ